MRRTTKYFFVGMALVFAYVLIFFSLSFLINVGQNQIATIVVSKVNGSPNFSNPGVEQFWSSVGAYHIALIEANQYPGSPAGGTTFVNVKMAWTNSGGTPLLMIRMEFPSTGAVSPNPPNPSTPMVNDTNHNKVVPLFSRNCALPSSSCYGGFYPQDVGFMPLEQGPQYVYPEQAIVMLGIAPGANVSVWYGVSYKPKLVLGTTGALGTGTGGAAEMWIWSRSPTDNASNDQAYPGLKYPNGTSLTTTSFGLPQRASYAIDGYTNATSFYQIGGLPNSTFMFPYINTPQFYDGNLSGVSASPIMNPFEVQAKGAVPASQGGNWVVEFVRPLLTSTSQGENKYQLEMNQNSMDNYHISFAVSQEGLSQTYLTYYDSVSFWYNFNFNTNSGLNGYTNQGEYALLNHSSLGGVLAIAALFLYSARKSELPYLAFSTRIS